MKRRSGRELRELFLSYFEQKGHKRYPSFSLVPDDPSLLFTIAGMVPFKPYFLGLKQPDVPRATTSQKCLRTNDIENVGRTSRHHTFFEMLGNFSFGDYFKESVIPWAWEFLTKEIGFLPERMYVTIYLDDDEAFDIWHKTVGLPEDRIVRMGEKDNFWAAGPVGPCGPCSELIYDQGPEFSCGKPDCFVGCDCDRYLEIWNLVFMQYNRDEAGNLTPLPRKNIDTGMGLERLASVVQGVRSDFETDLFMPMINKISNISGVEYAMNKQHDMAMRVIADHVRALAFMIADGVLPSNEGRGYVLRRLLRRASRYGRLLGLERPFLVDLLPTLVELMADPYKELVENINVIESVINLEEKKFSRTLDQGSALIEEEISRLKKEGKDVLPGETAFVLYDTYGFPLELTEEICQEHGIKVDRDGFIECMEHQREMARAASKQLSSATKKESYSSLLSKCGGSEFVGYELNEVRAKVVAIFKESQEVYEAQEGEEVEIFLDKTPFYAERGGQVGDRGWMESSGCKLEVLDTYFVLETLIAHKAKVRSGYVAIGDEVDARVDVTRRNAIRRHHTSTHIIHEALARVLGPHVRQAGSYVAPDYLRFDFNHFDPITREQLTAIERIANEVVQANIKVNIFETTMDEAKRIGAKAFFDEKYGERVRVIQIPGYCAELCGGLHVNATGEIGTIKIVKDESIGSGLRRITALAGMPAVSHHQELQFLAEDLASMCSVDVKSLKEKLASTLVELKNLKVELQGAKLKLALHQCEKITSQRQVVGDVTVLLGKFEDLEPETLRQVGDHLKRGLNKVLIVLGSTYGEKVSLVAMADEEAVKRGVHAGKLINKIAAIVGGGGGGRENVAQAGGKDASRLEDALNSVPRILQEMLGV
ncbi:MAG TPA: alanine--tRNA ligase [Acetomicrobium flavidum]|uniref:alanine--tRNA ligase n=1 Tax=Acetomicrobium flavidum TaxID=49896 RepID=UPI002C43CC8A|nr:alanine--tRNA ligase [Acetomicrobium flavidum]